MSVTAPYTRAHEAFSRVAHALPKGTTAYDVRVLVALLERGGSARMDELAGDLCPSGDYTALRRSTSTLYGRGLATGRGADGGERRPGTLTLVELTSRGRHAARVAYGLATQQLAEAVAA